MLGQFVDQRLVKILSGAQVTKLRQIAFDELAAAGPITPNPKTTSGRAGCPAD